MIYVSQAAADLPAHALTSIITGSRQRNAVLGITGALLFDGEWFAQLLEGEEATLRALMTRIEADPRHHGIVMLSIGARRAALDEPGGRWRVGWAPPDSVEALLHASAPDAAFQQLLVSCDMD